MEPLALPRTDPRDTAGLLLCRLRKKADGRSAASPSAGEVELENASSRVVELPVRSSPLEHLNLVVRDASDRIVSVGHYGDLFSPSLDARTFRLSPGEKYVGPVSFFATVPPERRHPGTYLIQAVYEHADLRAVSAPFRVEWAGADGECPSPP